MITYRVRRAVQLERGALALLEELLMRETRHLRQRGRRRRRRRRALRAVSRDVPFTLAHFLGVREM